MSQSVSNLADFFIIEDKKQITEDGSWKIKLLSFIVIVIFVIVISYYCTALLCDNILLRNITSKLSHFVIALDRPGNKV